MNRPVYSLAFALAFAVLACVSAARVSRPAGSLYDRPWRFVDDQGSTVTLAQWRGAPVVLTMFYCSCSTRCPNTIRKLRRMEEIFVRKNVRANFVLVTLDPRNDSPARLSDFKRAERMDAAWHLLAGGDTETRELARLLAVHPGYDDAHIDHDVRVAILDAAGEVTVEYEGWSFDEEAAVAAATQGGGV